MRKELRHMHARIGTQPQIAMLQHLSNARGRTATRAQWSHPMNMDERFKDARQHLTTVSSARNRINDPCRLLLLCVPHKHHPINPTSRSARRQLIIPALICLQLHPRLHKLGYTRRIRPMPV